MISNNGKDLSNFSMLDLFRSEMEVHAATLNDGLLSLENDPGGSSRNDMIEAMMRAAHSIKGGARIVELDPAVKLAHTMEDCFVAVQKGEFSLESDHIDILLKGVDMLIRISEFADEESSEWITAHQKEIETLISNISLVHTRTGRGNPPAAAQSDNRPHTPVHSKSASPAVVPSAISQSGSGEKEARKKREEEKAVSDAEEPGLVEVSDARSPIAETPGHGKNKHPVVAPSVHPESEIEETVEEISDTTQQFPSPIIETQKIASPQQREPILPQRSQTTSERKPPPVSAGNAEKDRMVRVTALKIERLMAMAGEVVVSSRWLPPFAESLMRLKKIHLELLNILEKLQEEYSSKNESEVIALSPGSQSGIWKRDKAGSFQGVFAGGVQGAPAGDVFEKMLDRLKDKARECNSYLLERLNQLEMYTGASENLSDRLYHEIIGVRMRPFADGIQVFPRMVRDLARELGKKVRFEIMGKSTEVDRDILEKLEAPLSHLLRNAIDHGIEYPEERIAAGKPDTGVIKLEAAHRSGMLMITVSDDGRGVNLDELRRKILSKNLTSAEMVDKLSEPELMEFLFLPGFSTLESVTEISGRGVGLDVVHNMVHEVRGIVRAVSKPGKGLSFHLELPLTLSVVRTFIVDIAKETYAFPLARIDRCLMLSDKEIETVEDRQYFRFDNKNISLVDIHDILELEKRSQKQDEQLSVVVISDRVHSYGLVVDEFLGECNLVVRPLDLRLGKVSDISSMAVMLDGSPVLIFDVEDLVRSIDSMLSGKDRRLQKISHAGEIKAVKTGKRILVVDDSITVREMERKLLTSKGYQVDVAVDGMEAWNLVRTDTYDMVISDIDMPRMNGFELITHIKQHEKLKSLPVMVVSYKNKEEDRLRGLEAGANYYLTKSSFQDNSFINAVVDLIGEA